MTKLKKDDKEQSALRDKTKYLIEETLTYIIEILKGKATEYFTDDDIAELDAIRDFKSSKLLSEPREKDGKRVIEYTHAVKLLKDFFAAKGYSTNYKNRIVSENKNNLDFDEKSFRKEYDVQCEKERKILELLGNTRNEIRGHDVQEADMIKIGSWIDTLEKYIKCFREYRLDILSEYDTSLGLQEQYDKLKSCLNDAKKLRSECFESTQKNTIIFRFGTTEYVLSDDNNEDFGELISDMAREWNNGIRHIRNDSMNEKFEGFIDAYYKNSNKLLDYKEYRDKLVKCEQGSTDESVVYMGILYKLYPGIKNLFWKGKVYTDSHFASAVLHILVRHPTGRGYGFEEKTKMLYERISGLDQWDVEKENKKNGIGIDILGVCRMEVISNYFSAHEKTEDNSGDGYTHEEIETAVKFEKSIREGASKEYIDDNYDEIIDSVLEMIAVMKKGKVTYWCPVTGKIFTTIDEYRDFIHDKLDNESIQDIYEYIKQVRNDHNLFWWVRHPKFSGEEN